MNEKTKGKTPQEERQERIQRLKEIYESNRDKSKEQIEKLFYDVLVPQGFTQKKIQEYVRLIVGD